MQQNCFYIGSIFKLHGYGNLIIYNENDFHLIITKLNIYLLK